MSLLQYLDTFFSTLCTSRDRNCRPEVFYKRGVLTNSAKLTGKHLHWDLFCNKVARCRPATSLNTESGKSAFL